jgi:hypothetical protein
MLLSEHVKSQTKKWKSTDAWQGGNVVRVIATVRHDDSCGNGHNTFSITGEVYILGTGNRWRLESCGCVHDDISKHIPELAPFIKWHLCSTDGPMHYVANTVYHASDIPEDNGKRYFYLENKLIKIVDIEEKERMIKKYGSNAVFSLYPNPMAKEADIEAARHCAIWPDATLEQLRDKHALMARLPTLMREFKKDVESLGFVY